MTDLDKIALEARTDDGKLESLIEQSASFILKCASSASRHPVSKSDDEWSVALAAFFQAVHDFRPERGRFLSFAELVIRRRLADYFKNQMRYRAEIQAAPEIFESGPLSRSPQPALQASVSKKLSVDEPEDLRLEIEAADMAFSRYGFSFFDLAACSPKAQKTKTACAKAVACLLKNPALLSGLHASGQLPIKAIEKAARIPRKILDRHRKYIIAAAEILSGEYPGLAEYMWFIRKELDR